MASNERIDYASDESEHQNGESGHSEPDSSSLDEYSSSGSENEDAEFTDALKSISNSEEIRVIFNEDKTPSVVSLVDDFKKIASSLRGEVIGNRCPPPPLLPSSSSSTSDIEILNSLSSISSRLDQFTSHLPTNLPDHTSYDSACNVARQISYWSSLFVSMCNSNSSPTPELTPSPSFIPTTSHTSPPSTILPSNTSQPQQPSSSIILTPPFLPGPSNSQPRPLSSTTFTKPPFSSIVPPPPSQPVLPASYDTHPPSSSVVPPPSQPVLPASYNTQPLPSTSFSYDNATYHMYLTYHKNHQTLKEWLDNLFIPRNVKTLDDVKALWEEGSGDCPPLCEWTSQMRSHKGVYGKHTSIFNQRKKVYMVYKDASFNEDEIKRTYTIDEVTPGKLYKHIYGKK